MPSAIESIELFYAHALAIEREAADRYSEFAAYFEDRDEEVLAGLCRNLARLEAEHFDLLLGASEGLSVPAIEPHRYRWLEAGSPEAPARELFYRIANARQLLVVALGAERNARRFFRWVARTSADSTVRSLARAMAAEETEHVRWVLQALEYRDPATDWERLLAAGIGPGVLTSG